MSRIKRLIALSIALIAAFTASPLIAQSDTADSLFAHAKEQASREQKNILLVFSASWCGPCKLFERFLEDSTIQPITEKAYVVVRIDVGERPGDTRHQDTPGGLQLRASLIGEREGGFPILVITDANGKPLIDSFRKGKANANIGYPDRPEEIDWYITMLKRTAPALAPNEIQKTRDWLTIHSTSHGL